MVVQSLRKELWKENRPYFWIFLSVSVVSILSIWGVQLAEGLPLNLSLYNGLIALSVLFIPLTAVNTIFFLKRSYLKHCTSKAQIIALKSLGLYIGIIAGTVLFELIYAHFGFEDNDYIAFGSFELSPGVSEVVSNLFIATVLGIPVFIRQQARDQSIAELNQKSKELETAHELNTQSQLEALQARVKPHFLYNSLNSIASLIHVNPDQAEKMVLSLSELFRHSLNYSNGQLSTVSKEVKIVETYLGIEQVRFGDQLSCEVKVDESIKNCLIPRFLLQPIVENAIKHGTSKVSNGTIKIYVLQSGNNIEFTVYDNGPNFNDGFDVGYGLKCVTDQLNLLYKDKHSFMMLNEPSKHVKIILQNAIDND
ncbi:MAG: histidine kinase [Bacteroidia bacterium]|nr:histidine kinase [Bacteroidia bacterium]